MKTEPNPWRALSALCVGFFMILLDMTIVAVANPAIMRELHADVTQLVWVTSAYLLTYAVPLLFTGRLGDRFGPKNIYLAGLALFTVASLACGMSGTINALIISRAVQGLGAALMAPQTMAVITRTFPAAKRGAAMGIWGAVAGVATLVGPLLGGVLVDQAGWEWIFYVNIPIGVVAFALAVVFVPKLPTSSHKFDVPGVVLSGIGMTLLVFGIQEGNTYDWDARIWALIGAGVIVLAGFLVYQARTSNPEPLLPLGLFRDHNFAMSNIAIAALGAAIAALMLPGYMYLQAIRDMTATESALTFAPMAVVTGFLSPIAGKYADKLHPRTLPTIGFSVFALSQAGFVFLTTPDSSIALIMLISTAMGVASACVWAPLAATATRGLPPAQAGAGSGVFNTTRQVGSVLGSAGVGALLAARLSAHGVPDQVTEHAGGSGVMPDQMKEAFSAALADSVWLAAGIMLISVVAAALFARVKPAVEPSPTEVTEPAPV